MILFDTDTLSQVLNPIPSSQLLSRMAELLPSQLFTTAITVGEMVYGKQLTWKKLCQGLLSAVGAWSDFDGLEEVIEDIYRQREQARDRPEFLEP